MKIKLEQAIKILEDAAAVIIDGNYIIHITPSRYQGDSESTFLVLNDGMSGTNMYYNLVNNQTIRFWEADNEEVEISGSIMTLIDENEEPFELKILVPQSLETKVRQKCEMDEMCQELVLMAERIQDKYCRFKDLTNRIGDELVRGIKR